MEFTITLCCIQYLYYQGGISQQKGFQNHPENRKRKSKKSVKLFIIYFTQNEFKKDKDFLVTFTVSQGKKFMFSQIFSRQTKI